MSLTAAEAAEQGKVLRYAMETRRQELIAKGFTEARFLRFDSILDAVVNKSSTQKMAHETLLQNTETQNAAIKNGMAMASKIQNAARSAFGQNKAKLKEFKIGAGKSKSVSKLTGLLDYLAGVCTKYHDELLQNGLTEEDYTSLSAAYASIVTADTVQEHSKKLRTVATDVRDQAVAALMEEMFKVRSFVRSAFAGNKAMLEEFKPVPRGRGKAKEEQQAVPAPPQP